MGLFRKEKKQVLYTPIEQVARDRAMELADQVEQFAQELSGQAKKLKQEISTTYPVERENGNG